MLVAYFVAKSDSVPHTEVDVVLLVTDFAAADLLCPVDIEGTVIFQELLYQRKPFDIETISFGITLEEMRNERADGGETLFVVVDESLM